MTDDKIIRFEAKSQIATKDFELCLVNNKYVLTICAYGDWWDEEFGTLDEVKEYLKDRWNFEEFPFLE